MSEGFFRYCTMDNPVFTSGLLWITSFIVFGSITLYHKYLEYASAERQSKQILEEMTTEATSTPAKAAAKTPKTVVSVAVKKQVEIPKAPTVAQEESGKKARKTKSQRKKT